MAEIGATLDVKSEDLREIERQRRRDILNRLGQAVLLIVSPILGILAAEAAYPVTRPSWVSYPFIPLMVASSRRSYFERRSWKAPIILSGVFFIVTFVLVALFNSAANDNYGVTTKYGVFSVRMDQVR